MRRNAHLLRLAACLALVGCAHARPGPPLPVGRPSALPASQASHVVLMVLENAEYGDVIGNASAPYVNVLARRYGLMTQSFATAHPSLPNYLALTSGSTQGIESDCTGCSVSAVNIVDQLEATRVSWRAYLEGVPGPCFGGATASAGGYAKKHNPFIYFDDIAHVRARCQKLVGFGALARDLRDGRLPSFVWITPNLCDDGHDCGVAGADAFLRRTVPLLLRELGPHGFLVLTWDEGTSSRGCCAGAARGGAIATILAGPDVRHGGRSNAPVDHYGVLATIEEAFSLPPLGGAAGTLSGRLGALFVRPPRIAAARRAAPGPALG
jgi:phosphatidylinositol-3-phosphatase